METYPHASDHFETVDRPGAQKWLFHGSDMQTGKVNDEAFPGETNSHLQMHAGTGTDLLTIPAGWMKRCRQ